MKRDLLGYIGNGKVVMKNEVLNQKIRIYHNVNIRTGIVSYKVAEEIKIMTDRPTDQTNDRHEGSKGSYSSRNT